MAEDNFIEECKIAEDNFLLKLLEFKEEYNKFLKMDAVFHQKLQDSVSLGKGKL